MLLGVTKVCVIRMDVNTKEVLSEWKLSHLRRWVASTKRQVLRSNLSFTLDMGDYETQYYQVETTEGEEIARLLSGYVEILVKKRNMLTTKPTETNVEEQAVVEDYVKPGQSKNVSIVTSQVTAKVAKHIQGDSEKRGRAGTIHSQQRPSRVQGALAENLDIVESQELLIKKIKTGLDALDGYLREIMIPIALPTRSNDSASIKWRQDTSILNSEALAAHIAGLLAAVSGIMMNANGDAENMNYPILGADLTSVVAEASNITQILRVLCGLTTSDEDQEDLMAAGHMLVDSACSMLKELQPVVTGHKVLIELHTSASRVANSASNVLVLTDQCGVSDASQNELVSAATDVGLAVKEMIEATNGIKMTVGSPEKINKLQNAIQSSIEAAAALAVISSIMSSVITDPLSKDQMIETALVVRERIAEIEKYCNESPDSDELENFRNTVLATDEALAFLIEKAKNVESSLEYEIQYYHDQINSCAGIISQSINYPQELFAAAKEMAINGTRLAEVMKVRSNQTSGNEDPHDIRENGKAISDLMGKMVAATRSVIADPGDSQAQSDLLALIDEISVMNFQVCEPFIKINLIQNLILAYRGTITCSNHVVSSGRKAAVSNRDRTKQTSLNKSGKVLVEKIPNAIRTINNAMDSPSEYIVRFKLIESAKDFVNSVENLIDSSRDATTTISDSSSKNNLYSATERLAEEFENFRNLLAITGQNFDQIDYKDVIKTMKSTDIAVNKANIESPLGVAEVETQLTDVSKQFGDAMKEVSKAIALGDFVAAKKAVVESVAEFQTIQMISARSKSDSENKGLRNDLLTSVATLGDALGSMIEKVDKISTGEQDAKDFHKTATKTSICLNEVLGNLPRQKQMVEALGTIKQLNQQLGVKSAIARKSIMEQRLSIIPVASSNIELNVDRTLQSALTAEAIIDDYLNVQVDMLSAATDLSSATKALSNYHSDPAVVKLQIQNLEKCFGKLIQANAEVAITDKNEKVSSAIHNIGLETDFFLNALQASFQDNQSVGLNEQLVFAANAVGGCVNELLGIFASSDVGLDDCTKALQILLHTSNVVADINKPRKKNFTFTDIQFMTESYIVDLGTQCKEIQNSANSGDGTRISSNVQMLALLMQDLITSAVHGAHLLAAADPTSTPSIPSKIDLELVQTTSKDSRLSLAKLLLLSATQDSLFDDASQIARNTAVLCNLCKTAGLDSSISIELRNSLSDISNELAKQSRILIPAIKNLAVRKGDSNREKLAVPSGIYLEQLGKLERLVDLPAFMGQNAKPSANGISLQQPILENASAAIYQARGIVTSAQTLLKDAKNNLARNELAHQLSLLTTACARIVDALKGNSPALLEITTALSSLRQTNRDLEKTLAKTEKGETLEEKGGDAHTLADALKSIVDMTEGVLISSRADMHALVQHIEELPDRFDMVHGFYLQRFLNQLPAWPQPQIWRVKNLF